MNLTQTVTLFPSISAADNEITLKCLVLGEQNVGKTSILGTLIDKTFDPQSAPTIGIDFRVLRATVSTPSAKAKPSKAPLTKAEHLRSLLADPDDEHEHESYKLQIWDSAGQYRFRSIVSSYYRLAHIFIIVFDLCDRESYMHVRNWRQSVDEQRETSAFLIYLIGNKSDNVKERCIDETEARNLSYELNFDGYFEVSAKNKAGLNDAFKTIILDAHGAVEKRIFSGIGRSVFDVSESGVVDLRRKPSSRNFLSQCCG